MGTRNSRRLLRIDVFCWLLLVVIFTGCQEPAFRGQASISYDGEMQNQEIEITLPSSSENQLECLEDETAGYEIISTECEETESGQYTLTITIDGRPTSDTTQFGCVDDDTIQVVCDEENNQTIITCIAEPCFEACPPCGGVVQAAQQGEDRIYELVGFKKEILKEEIIRLKLSFKISRAKAKG